MAKAKELLAVIGESVDSTAVRDLVEADGLEESVETNLEEGEPQRAYLSNPAAGYQLLQHSGRVVSAFLFAEPAKGFEAFPGPLPGGLSRWATRSEVRARFGVPERKGDAVTIPGLGRQGAWDRFDVGTVHVHFQYTEPEQRIRLVTIMAPADAP